MTLIEFLLLALSFYFLYKYYKNSDEYKKEYATHMQEKLEKNIVVLNVEKLNNTYLAYKDKDSSFFSQGKDFNDLIVNSFNSDTTVKVIIAKYQNETLVFAKDEDSLNKKA